ncbi:MAG: copper chaperone PCu(A)C [Pseudomonadota bacterium]
MKPIFPLGFALAALVALPIGLSPVTSGPAAAHEAKAGALTIIHPMARATLPNRPMALYMAISNDGSAPDRLLSANSPQFDAIEIHESKEQNGVMTMVQLEAIEAPAEDTALLEPGGLHLMLFGAKKHFKEGDEFPVTLMFENAGAVDVTVKVEKAGHGDHSHHSGHGEATN